MGKITCATCLNEDSKKCTVKKGTPTIHPNKRRQCGLYVLEPTKVKAKQIIKTVRMGYSEREALRAEYKKQLKQLKRDSVKVQAPRNVQHPLTGDLSRFTSTAGSDRSGG